MDRSGRVDGQSLMRVELEADFMYLRHVHFFALISGWSGMRNFALFVAVVFFHSSNV
jgi:hypothetical protein